MKRILFQGDSITDCGRDRNDAYSLGTGYAQMVSAMLGMDFPQEYAFMNRGIHGNRSVDVYGRIQEDFIDLNPDYASILVGVNDIGRTITKDDYGNTARYEKMLKQIIDDVQAACPGIKLMILTPFVLEGCATCGSETIPDKYEKFCVGIAEEVEMCKKLAKEYDLPVVDLQAAFTKALEKAPAQHWSADGVHPTLAGHEIIKRLWLETFEEMK